MTYGKRPPLDEEKALFESQVAREGVTTGAGAPAGNSFFDAALIGFGANSFVSMLAVVYPGQPNLVDSFDITAFDNGFGEVTLSHNYKGGQIPAGVPYKIVTFRFVPAEVAALTTKVDDIEAKLDAGVPKLYVEQIPDTDVDETVTDTETDCVLVNLPYIAGKTYGLRYLRLKCGDPGVGRVVTVKLYERWNDAIAQLIDSFDITSANCGTYHSLMDTFGVPEIHSDAILIRALHDGTSPGDDVAIEVTYRYAIATT